jgi:AcrR family transcriptional regulator
MKKRPRKRQKATHSAKALPARSQLLAAARVLFARKGLSGTTIRGIAEEAKINSSMISYYFEGKEGLYKACIEEIAQNSLMMAERVLGPATNETEFKVRLHMFLDGIFALLLEDRDTGLILMREFDRLHSPAQDIFRESFLKILNMLVDFFKSGQKAGLVAPERDPFTLASLLFGCVTSQMRMDHFQEKAYKKSLLNTEEKRKVENHIVDLFTIPPRMKR